MADQKIFLFFGHYFKHRKHESNKSQCFVATNMASSKAPAGYFTILYFAAASTFAGKTTEHLPAPLRICDLFGKLDDTYPGIKEKVLGSCAITINLEYVDLDEDGATGSDRVIKEGDEVAIIPPVSSG